MSDREGWRECPTARNEVGNSQDGGIGAKDCSLVVGGDVANVAESIVPIVIERVAAVLA